MEGVSLSWDGSEPVRGVLSLEVSIDSRISIYPLSLPGAVPGLVFAASPAVLPPGSFQVEGSLLFGSPAGDRPFSTLPFEASARLGLPKEMEAAASLNTVPVFGAGASWGFALSAKWRFLRTRSGPPLELAAGLSYGWSENEAGSFRSSGLSARFPMSLELGVLSLIFAPGLRTNFPRDPVPRLFLPGGLLLRFPGLSAGLSFLPEFGFSSRNAGGAGPVFQLGAEIKWYPPPSTIVYTILGGIRIKGTALTGFGGVGLGIVY
jgi:hypothetical protein